MGRTVHIPFQIKFLVFHYEEFSMLRIRRLEDFDLKGRG